MARCITDEKRVATITVEFTHDEIEQLITQAVRRKVPCLREADFELDFGASRHYGFSLECVAQATVETPEAERSSDISLEDKAND